MIRAAQGHSGARFNISLFTRELFIDDDDLPVESVHGTQASLDSIMEHGLVPGGLTAGETPVRARDMVHVAVSRPSRLRGLPQLAALHRHRRYLICLNLRSWLEDNRRAWLTENDVLLIHEPPPRDLRGRPTKAHRAHLTQDRLGSIMTRQVRTIPGHRSSIPDSWGSQLHLRATRVSSGSGGSP